MSREVVLGGKIAAGRVTLIDEADYDSVTTRSWHLGSGGYVTRYQYVGPKNGRSNYTPVLLHRQLLDAPKGLQVDHINGDRLDNRRSNLRICTRTQNMQNRRNLMNQQTGFKGVCRNGRGRYVARITVNYVCYYVGSSTDDFEAAAMYDAAAIQLFGQFANLNLLDRL